jgi:tRNA(fMet)-specific endonuclease VapC
MGGDSGVASHLAALAPDDEVAISSVTRGEIRYGIARLSPGKRRSDVQTRAERLFERLLCLSVTETAADRYGEIKAALDKVGRPIGKDNDLWIAAVAVGHGCVLVSGQASFDHVPGLVVEDWTR